MLAFLCNLFFELVTNTKLLFNTDACTFSDSLRQIYATLQHILKYNKNYQIYHLDQNRLFEVLVEVYRLHFRVFHVDGEASTDYFLLWKMIGPFLRPDQHPKNEKNFKSVFFLKYIFFFLKKSFLVLQDNTDQITSMKLKINVHFLRDF